MGKGRQKSGELYSAYRQYCEVDGEQPHHNSDFSQALIADGFDFVKQKDGNYYRGLTLKANPAPSQSTTGGQLPQNVSMNKGHLYLV